MARQMKSHLKSRSKAQRQARIHVAAAVAMASFATTGVAQIAVPISNVQPGTSASPSPNAAYSNITNYLGTTVGSGSGGLSGAAFSNLTPAPELQGQVVQSLRLGVQVRAELTGLEPTRRGRVQVGFWNADGPNGLAGTPLQGLTGFAQYQTDTLTLARGASAIITLDLGPSGFVVPSGRFYFGIAYDVRGFAESSSTDFAFNLYGAPTAGTNQPAAFGAEYATTPTTPVYGIPWGVSFGSSPYLVMFSDSSSLGMELIVPAPSSAVSLALGSVLVFRRRRGS